MGNSEEGNIDCSSAYVELPTNIVSPPAAGSSPAPAPAPALATTPVQAEKKKKYHLSSSTDPLFGELRDVNFAALGPLLSSTARRLSNDYEVGLTLPAFRLVFHATWLTTPS